MNRSDDFAARLAAAARRAEPSHDTEPPAGFTTRVLAQLRERPPSLWERFALGAIPIAAVLTVACVWFTRPAPDPQADDPRVIASLMLEHQLPPQP